MASWPTQSDYKDSLQNPDTAFRDPDLRQSQAERSPMGVPRARSGAFASVYKMTGPKGVVALKLFNFPNEDRARRYKAVSDYLERTLGPKKPPCVVKFQYHTEGIRVGKAWYPTLTMAWVKGVALGEWVRQTTERKVPDVAALKRMAESWVGLVQQLQATQIAHGDLQHDNVLVVNDAPVLVDYDGMCVPALAPADPKQRLEQLEFGKPAYQHPARAAERLGADLDHFSAWVVLVALRAIAADPQLYVKYVLKTDNENLLFTPADMERPAKSQLWPDLMRSKDPEVAEWARNLRASLDKPFAQIPPFTLDPFARLRSLLTVSARDWAQIETETVRLRRAGKDLPADLKGSTDPVAALRGLCDAPVRDWPRIAAEGARLEAAGRALPTDLRAVCDTARKRVVVREALKRAVDERNPRATAAAYQPALLDDWLEPHLLTAARAAAGLVPLLDALKAATVNPGDGRALVKLWDDTGAKLSGAAEARAYEAAANGWRARIRAADAFLAAFAKSPQTERELSDAWQGVVTAGPPHPSLGPAHRARGENAARWWPALEKLRRVPAGASHENDSKLVGAWGDGAGLGACAEAAPFAARVTEARARLALVEALERAIRGAEQGGPEEAVLAAAGKLPPNYPHPHTVRVLEGAESVQLLAELRREAERPQPSDRAIAAAYDRLKARNLRFAARLDKVNPGLFRRAEEAVVRRKLLDRFAGIDRDERRKDRQDQKWLALWGEQGKLLTGCADREELRERLTLARDRLEKWAKVAEALKARDMFTLLARLGAPGPDLTDYPPLVARAAEVGDMLGRAERVVAIRQRIGAGSPLTPEDMALLREHHDALDAGTKAAIEAQVRARLAGDARLVPAYPAYTITGKRGGLVKACWAWGGHGLIAHCVVAVDARRFLTDPAEADPYSRLNCLAENHQREGGGVTLVPPAGAAHAYVTVWPVVELGWKTVYGPPLNIGPVPVGSGTASPTGTRW
ncbi:hypothetical protein R5W24_004006 [Gemmata sp. JC717]|uniref:hypothetical protein n=1 Tax=Gemmata algarum TaxID=2975278 RepID=UPI0021BAD050|nr:hypothetical protein [Gemmata algarum]MDY3554876.1 hypothetical protein [Gemmata algarum]